MIRTHNLCFGYSKNRPILQDITLSVRQGEHVALIGGNGSGKTTLARHLNGLLRPTSGQIFVNNLDTSCLNVPALARHVAFVFQNPDDQLYKRRVWDEVAFGATNMGYDRDRIQALTRQALDWWDLHEQSEVNPHDLTQAWRRRVAIASALAMDTPILILDEPTVNQDLYFHRRLVGLLKALRERGKTILLICHDMDFVAENCDRILLLKNGRITEDGHAEEVFRHADIMQQAGLQQPQITRLSQALGCDGTHITSHALIGELLKKRLKAQSDGTEKKCDKAVRHAHKD